MAAKKFEKGGIEYAMFGDYYKLMQAYYIPENTDAYWEELVKSAEIFAEQYRELPLSEKLIQALLDSLEDKFKKDNHNNPPCYETIIYRVKDAVKRYQAVASDKDTEIVRQYISKYGDRTESKILSCLMGDSKCTNN